MAGVREKLGWEEGRGEHHGVRTGVDGLPIRPITGWKPTLAGIGDMGNLVDCEASKVRSPCRSPLGPHPLPPVEGSCLLSTMDRLL